MNEVGLSEELNILKDGCKNYLILCLYSMAVEWYFLKNPVPEGNLMMLAVSDEEKESVEFLRRNPDFKEKFNKMVEEHRNKSSQPNRRFIVSSSTGPLDYSVDADFRETGVTLDSYIITKKTEPYPEEYGSLHISVPNHIMEGIIRLRFHFCDKNRYELPFTYITNGASLIHRLKSAMDKGTKPCSSGWRPCH